MTRATPPAISPTKRDVTSTRPRLSFSVDHNGSELYDIIKSSCLNIIGWFLFFHLILILWFESRSEEHSDFLQLADLF